MLKLEPITFSTAFGLSSEQVCAAGAVDVTLNCDTKLFIDPLLLKDCNFREFRDCSTSAYRERFELVIKLISASKKNSDKAWTAARRHLSFPELPYTHLGYSSGPPGSGFGSLLTDSLIESAKMVIDLGVDDPDIFVALALFEENVGADRISDMTSHIILRCLISFTQEVTNSLGIETAAFQIRELGREVFHLPANPTDFPTSPVILVPHDVVRDLPIASDWDSIASVARETQDLRDRVNEHIGDIWAAKTKEQKRIVRSRLVSSRTAVELFLTLLRDAADAPYDIRSDQNGEIYPADLRRAVSEEFPLDLSAFSGQALSSHAAEEVVTKIIEQFRHMIENNGIWSLLWNEKLDRPRREKAAQQVFFATANAYCDANNLDITPEANAGSGPVDFKFSSGSSLRILVEIKKSSNTALVTGYTNQLEIYRRSESTAHAHYVVLDYGSLSPEKKRALEAAHDAARSAGERASKIWYIDASRKLPASKRKL